MSHRHTFWNSEQLAKRGRKIEPEIHAGWALQDQTRASPGTRAAAPPAAWRAPRAEPRYIRMILRYHKHSFERLMTLEPIRGLVTADFEAVDRVVKQRLHSQVALVDQVASYIIYAGGKRLRPLLVLLAARACGHKGEHHVDAAAIIEFICTATLPHERVLVDGSCAAPRPRDRQPMLFDNAKPVFWSAAFSTYSRAFQHRGVRSTECASCRSSLDATNAICRGRGFQLMNADPKLDSSLHRCDPPQDGPARLFEAGGTKSRRC